MKIARIEIFTYKEKGVVAAGTEVDYFCCEVGAALGAVKRSLITAALATGVGRDVAVSVVATIEESLNRVGYVTVDMAEVNLTISARAH